jgi:hypothetical protein
MGSTLFCVSCCALQDYIQRLMAEKADLDKRFHGMKDELIMRLQNACAQRDEARAQVLSIGWTEAGICCLRWYSSAAMCWCYF